MYGFYQPHMYEVVPEDFDEEDRELKTLTGKQFDDFLDFCFGYAALLSLTKGRWLHSVDKSLETALAPYQVKEIKSRRWFCYWFPEPTMEIHIYKAVPETKAILLKYYHDLFMNRIENCTSAVPIQTLEDLCLFTQDALFLGTVSHEYMCYAYPPDPSFEKRLRDFGHWLPLKDSVEDQIHLPQFI